MILVHDLTNRKSHQNLGKWLAEVLNRDTYVEPNGFVFYCICTFIVDFVMYLKSL